MSAEESPETNAQHAKWRIADDPYGEMTKKAASLEVRLRAAEAQNNAYKTVVDLLFESLPDCPFLGDLPGCVDELKAELAGLRADAERYRWLKRNHLQTGQDSWIRTRDDLEDAIDAAMKGKT